MDTTLARHLRNVAALGPCGRNLTCGCWRVVYGGKSAAGIENAR